MKTIDSNIEQHSNENSGKTKEMISIVGAGPGDPELITLKGLNRLKEADLVVYADSLVSDQLLAACKEDAVIMKSSGMTLEEMVGAMVAAVREGKKVVRLHTGDPSVFGATNEQVVLLAEQGVGFEVIPGVSSVFSAAASLGAELTIPEVTQTLILTRAEGRTPVPEKESLKELARHNTTLAIYLSATLAPKIQSELREAGWGDEVPVMVVQKSSWPDEKIVASSVGTLVDDIREAGIRSQAMILAGKVFQGELIRDKKSKLYDAGFSHGFRKTQKKQ